MKSELNLTKQDKMDIINKYPNYLKNIENLGGFRTAMLMSFGIALPLTAILVGAFVNPTAYILVLLGAGFYSLSELFLAIETKKSFKKFVTDKITYKQYKELVKSGEIQKWKEEQYLVKQAYKRDLIEDKEPVTLNPSVITDNVKKRKEIEITCLDRSK